MCNVKVVDHAGAEDTDGEVEVIGDGAGLSSTDPIGFDWEDVLEFRPPGLNIACVAQTVVSDVHYVGVRNTRGSCTGL